MKKALLKKIYALFLISIFCFAAHRASASHAMASDLTFKCLGGNTYEFTLTFYRDCAGIPAPNNPVITVKSASCGQNLTLTLSPIPGTGQDVTPKCSSTVTTCSGGTALGVQEWVYTGIITLPMECTDWTFGYELCCRNAAITTINAPGTSTIYIASTLNNTGGACVNSPVFTNKPVPFVCVGQQFCFSEAATDSDGDSLAYQLITPMQTPTTTVNYLAGYTPQQPLSSSPPMSFDSTNGEICMTPEFIQVTVMAVLVKDYRNGVLVSSVERDMQIIVMNCNNNLPWLSGINGTNVFNMTVCAGAPFCFDILSNDIDTGQTLTITPNTTIPGATFTSAGNPHPTSNFCWTPADSQISSKPYFLTVTVKDNACPYNGSQTFTYAITVKGITVNLGPDQQISCTDLASIYATVNSPDAFTYSWSTGDSTNFITAGAGTYWCTVTDATCSATDTVVVTSPFVPVAAFTNTIPVCLNNAVNFTDQSTSFSSTVVTWAWNFGDGSPVDNNQNTVHTYTDTGTYIVQLAVTNNLGCVDTVTHIIVILPAPNAAFTWVNACQGQAITFTDQSSASATSWNWSFGDGQTSATKNTSHTYTTSGSYTVTLISSNGGGCSDTVSHQVTAYPIPTASFNAAPVCLGGSTTFNNTSTGATTWNWNFGNGVTATTQNPTYTYGGTGTYSVTLIVTSSNGCIDTIIEPVTVNALPIANAGPAVAICNGNSTTLTASGGTTYQWNPGGAITSTYLVNPIVTTTYTVTVSNASGCSTTDTVSVIVNPVPVANAGPDINICNGSSGTLTASGGGNYLWSSGGNTNASINVTPTITTTYTVTVTNATGCSSSDQVNVIVHNLPVLSLAGALICTGDTATLNAGAAGLNYLWSTSETTQAINVTNGGTYSVTATDAFGCSSSASCVVTSGAIGTINPSSATVCQGQTATFDAGSPGGTYIWSNGQTTETITTGIAGTYSVTVTNVSGCTAIGLATLSVHTLPVASAGVDQSICTGSSATLTANGGLTYQWSPVVSNNQTVNVNPVVNTTYYVTATDAFGCTASDSVNVVVNALPVVTLSPVSICTGASTTLNAGNAGSTYLWTPNGELTQSISVNAAGNYGVTVTNGFGCSAAISTTVTSGGLVTINPSATAICQGQSTILDAGNPGFSFLWSTGDTTQTVSVTTGGTYSITVTNLAGCSATIADVVTQNPTPVDNFASPSVCFGNAASFTDQSSISSGSIVSWNWTFGDGQSSAQQNPTHNYTSAGTYSVTLVVNSNNGCPATSVQPVTINPLPLAAFSTNAVCQGDSSMFTDLSHVSSGNIVSWNWSFGDGQTANTQDPGYIYAQSGNYNATLIVSTNNGCVDTASAQVVVNGIPNPAFSAPDICYGAATVFNNTSTISNGSISSYIWNFGDSTTSTLQQPSHQYANNGSYMVSLTETSAAGCVGSTNAQVNVYLPPIAAFLATDSCLGTATYFSSRSSSQDSIMSQDWNFGDGNTGTGREVAHSYSLTGQYQVSLVVTTAHGCSNAIAHPVNIYPSTSPFITAPSVCEGAPVSFINTGDTVASEIITTLWSFGDGTTSDSLNVTHAYTGYGTYNVSLQTTNQFGCSVNAATIVEVYPKPTTGFNTANECSGTPITFSNTSNIPSGNIVSYYWDFGDNIGHSTLSNPSYKYTMDGTYSVTLNSISDHGCPANLQKPVTEYPLPVVIFNGVASGCSPFNGTFTDQSTIDTGSIVGWLWTFGDGDVSTSQNPDHVYTNPGSYIVTLTVSSDKGCIASGSAAEHMNVFPSAKAEFTMNPTSIDIMNPLVHFTNLSTNYDSYKWDFGDGSTSTVFSPSHLYADAGDFTIVLVVNNSYNCPDTAMRRMDINPISTLYAPNAFTPNGDGINDVWKPAYTDMSDIQVWIYDRWGEMLTNWNSLDGYWDGVYKGRLVQQGVYVYQIEGTGQDGKLYKWTGDITVVR